MASFALYTFLGNELTPEKAFTSLGNTDFKILVVLITFFSNLQHFATARELDAARDRSNRRKSCFTEPIAKLSASGGIDGQLHHPHKISRQFCCRERDRSAQ